MTATTADAAVRIPDLEVWFDEKKIPWVLDPALPLSMIDQAAGLENQARLHTLTGEVVERYAADMAADATFPAIVVRRLDNPNRLPPLGGNHRLAAAKKSHRKAVAAYVVGPIDDLTAHLVALQDNRHHGLPLTDEERVYHAVELSNTGEFTQDEAARIAGVPTATLRLHLSANKAAKRAIKLNIAGWPQLSVSTRARLAGIDDDRVFVKATRAVVAGHIQAGRVGDFVKRINDTKGVSSQVALVEEHVTSARKLTQRRGGRPPSAALQARVRLLGDLDALMRFDAGAVAADCSTDFERRRVSEQCKAAVRHLMAIEKGLWR